MDNSSTYVSPATRPGLLRRIMQVGLVVAVVAAITGCSGGDTPTDSAVSTGPNAAESNTSVTTADDATPFAAYVDGPIADAAATIVEDHGEGEGFAVTVIALDNGYSLQQIVDDPRIDSAGTLPGLDPAGEPLGLVVAGPSGFSSTATPPSPSDQLYERLGISIGQVHLNASKLLGEQVAAELAEIREAARADVVRAEAQAEGARVLTVMLLLIAQGYSVEEAIEGIIFGDYIAGGGVACARLTEPPSGPRIEALDPGCDIDFGASDTTPTVNDTTAEPVAAPTPGDGSDDSEFEEARFVGAGSFSESGDGSLFGDLGGGGGDDGPESEVLIDVAEFVAGDDLSGGIELLANLDVFGDLDCFYISYQFADVALVGDGTQTYAGSGTATGAFPDEPCSGTTPPAGQQTGSIDIEATVVGDELRITLSAEGEDEPLTVTATRVDD